MHVLFSPFLPKLAAVFMIIAGLGYPVWLRYGSLDENFFRLASRSAAHNSNLGGPGSWGPSAGAFALRIYGQYR